MRNVIQYGSATSVKVKGSVFDMLGFRFQGQYLKHQEGKVFDAPDFSNTVDLNTDLSFGMTEIAKENWYALFACANDDDTSVAFRAVPFLRVKGHGAGGSIELNKAGEAIHSAESKEYPWMNGALNGSDCLIITETVDGRDVAFSGRTTKIINSTPSTVTLENKGSIGALDWILPSPSNEFDHYKYCGSFYFDTGEVRNFSDSGSIVKSRGIFDVSGTNNGAVTTPELRQVSGYISPLATAVTLFSQAVLSTTGAGNYSEDYMIDTSDHEVSRGFYMKRSSAAETVIFGDVTIPLMFGPQYAFRNGGGLEATRVNGQQNIYGWVEM